MCRTPELPRPGVRPREGIWERSERVDEGLKQLREAVGSFRAAAGMPPLLDPAFGHELRRLRTARGLSVRAFAGRCGVSPAFVSRVERAEQPPPGEETIRRIARELGEDEFALLKLAGKLPKEMVAALLELEPREWRAALRRTTGERE